MSKKLGADLSSVRNTVYDVQGKRVQINVILTPDSGNAEMDAGTSIQNSFRAWSSDIRRQ